MALIKCPECGKEISDKANMLYDEAKALISDYSYKDAEGYEQYVRKYPDEYSEKDEQPTDIIDGSKAVELVTNYLIENDIYVPEYIEVENEDNENYVVHCFDMGEHMTQTVGWFYVNKETSEVTSMFE
ncbi:MAG: hypothetical protein PHS04_05355 [Tissierellia bacterium]|nr:hypothetical protein [Tissierellia bacterium]MDD4437446.1 hypothetical protein [Tissierellia bacterium]